MSLQTLIVIAHFAEDKAGIQKQVKNLASAFLIVIGELGFKTKSALV